MIDGVLLGLLTFVSMVLTFRHLPERVKSFLVRHFLITDLISIALTFLALSSISQSITSVIGSVVCGLLVNIALELNETVNSNLVESTHEPSE